MSNLMRYVNTPRKNDPTGSRSYQDRLIKPAIGMLWTAKTGVKIIITEVDMKNFHVKFKYEGSTLTGLSAQECGIVHLNQEYTFVPSTKLEETATRVTHWDKRFIDVIDGFSFEEWVDKCKELFYTCPMSC